MVALVGNDSIKPSDFVSFNSNLALEAQITDQPMWFFAGVYYDASDLINFSAKANSGFSQVVPAQRVLNGVQLENFFEDFYFRIHLTPPQINVGNLAANETYSVNVWNSYLVPKTVLDITEVLAEGISWVGPTPPATFTALQEVAYQFTISRIGPSKINASFVFDFLDANDPILKITGSRVVLFPYKPRNGLTERLEWKTDVLQAYTGEQRIALRHAARTTYSYDYLLDAREFAMAKNLTEGWGARTYAVPVWMEGSDVSVNAGSLFVLLDTQFKDYRDESTIVIFGDDGRSEVATIQEVQSDRLIFSLPFPSTIAGRIYPVRFARLLAGINFDREPTHINTTAVFSVEDNAAVEADPKMIEYAGLPVITDCQVMRNPITERIYQSVTILDNGSGPIAVEENLGYISKLRTLSQLRISREQRWRLRAFLSNIKGKRGAFWLPTFNADLVAVAPINAGQSALIVANVNFGLYVAKGYLLIRLKTGQMLFRKVIGVIGVPEGEQIATDEVFPTTLFPSDIDKIMFVEKVRLDTDVIELRYPALQLAEFSAAVKEVPE